MEGDASKKLEKIIENAGEDKKKLIEDLKKFINKIDSEDAERSKALLLDY